MSSGESFPKSSSGATADSPRPFVHRWGLRLLVLAAGISALLFAVATSLLFGLWLGHFGKLSEPSLFAIGITMLSLQLALYGFLLWRLISRKWRFKLRSMLVATAILAVGLGMFGMRLRHGWQRQYAVWQAAQLGATVLHMDAALHGGEALTWLERRFGYDPWQDVEWLRIQSDDALSAVIEHRDGFDELAGIHIARGVSDAGLKRAAELSLLPKLDTADVFSWQITDAGLQHLARWRGLRGLCINGCPQITDKGLAELAKISSLTSLLILSEGGTPIRISRKGLASLAKLPRLERLILADSTLTDADLAPLARMQRLKMLVLRRVNITDAGLPHLYALQNLQTLSIRDTKVTAKGIEELRRALPNTEVHTDITAAGPAVATGPSNE